jgi:hypothetical protein
MCNHATSRALQHRTQPLSRGGLRGCHMSSASESCLPDRKGFSAAMSTVALDPASLQGRAPVCHMSYSSESWLPAGEGSEALRVLQL